MVPCAECGQTAAYAVYEVTLLRRGSEKKQKRALCAPCGMSLPSKGYSRMKEVTEEGEVQSWSGDTTFTTTKQFVMHWREYPVVRCIELVVIMDVKTWKEARELNNAEQQRKRNPVRAARAESPRSAGPSRNAPPTSGLDIKFAQLKGGFA
jgi:hypothetical protein